MKFKEVKNKLKEKGFNLEYIQTSGNLDMVHFENPNIKGTIDIDFKYDIDLPADIENGREFSYDDDNEIWLLEFSIQSITFNIDKSISFMSEDVLDTCGDNDENKIILCDKDLYLFEKVLNIIIDPLSNINFQQEYTNEVNKFCEWVKQFIPILNKYGFISNFSNTSGNETTLFRSFVFYFYKHTPRNSVNFYFKTLNWNRDIVIGVEPRFLPDSGEVGENVSLEVFEEELVRQLNVAENFYEKLKT